MRISNLGRPSTPRTFYRCGTPDHGSLGTSLSEVTRLPEAVTSFPSGDDRNICTLSVVMVPKVYTSTQQFVYQYFKTCAVSVLQLHLKEVEKKAKTHQLFNSHLSCYLFRWIYVEAWTTIKEHAFSGLPRAGAHSSVYKITLQKGVGGVTGNGKRMSIPSGAALAPTQNNTSGTLKEIWSTKQGLPSTKPTAMHQE